MSPKRRLSDRNTSDLAAAAPVSPPRKRPRIHGRNPVAPAPAAPAPAAVDDMYHFPSSRPQTTVDLTSSPPSPAARRIVKTPTISMSAQPGQAPRRMLVKNFRPARKVDPAVFLEQTWARIQAALDIVFAGGSTDFSLEELYRGVENLCRQGMARQTYARLEAAAKAHVAGALRANVQQAVGRKDVDVLRAALHEWATWMGQKKVIDWIFCYLDRSYLLPRMEPARESLHDMVVNLFREHVFEWPAFTAHIVDGACALVAADRAGEDLDRRTFENALNMFHEMRVYTGFFEPRLLELSQQYIATWSERASAEKGLADYVKAACALLHKEMERVDVFRLPGTTKRDLLTLLEDLLISRQESRLTNEDEFADLLDDNAVKDIELLYSLLERRKLGVNLRTPFMKWIDLAGTEIVFDDKEQASMVVRLLTLKRQLDTLWKVSFHRNSELGHGLREAFEAFMNKTKKSSTTWNTDNSKPGEMIAKYVDLLLRGGAKAIPARFSRKRTEHGAEVNNEEDEDDVALDEDAEVNNQLDQVLDLFRFVHGKAVFEAFYKKDLARRLLMGRSASADAERSMLARLKTECGANFTANLEQMFKDIELSREEMSSYKSILEERREKQSLDLTVNVLSQSAWPSYPDVLVIIPPQIKAITDQFEEHYKSKHSGRTLYWKHALAHCQVKAKFPRGNKELVVSSFQAIVLLLFNGVQEDEHIEYSYLKAATGLPDPELKRTLQSLACAKLRPLSKHPKGREVLETDTFSLNTHFSDAKYRIKINTVQLKETPTENKETHERVAEDRNYETQAAIVRILKARKNISHNELIAETIKVTRSRGQLDVAGIKRNIDRLIEKDYMEREEDNTYSYVA